MERLVTAAQDQALRTNLIKAEIDKQEVSLLCRMCGKNAESVNHIICECSKPAQTEYKCRHDNGTRIIHWELSKENDLPHASKWCHMNTSQRELWSLMRESFYGTSLSKLTTSLTSSA